MNEVRAMMSYSSHPGLPMTRGRSRRHARIRSPATEEKLSVQCPTPTSNEEIVPLSGNPFFITTFSQSQIISYRVVVPKQFHDVLPRSCVPVFLSYGSRTWEVKYCGDKDFKRFSTGWKEFAVDNNLRDGDGCVFELMDSENLHFKVQILRVVVPALSDRSGHGVSTDTPILID